MICPFCRETEVGCESGPSTCPTCKAGFEIDDRGECIFVDTENPRIPADGQVWVGATDQAGFVHILRDNIE